HNTGSKGGGVQRLQPNFTRPFQDTQEQSLATKEDIGEAFDGLDIILDVRFKKSDVAGVDFDALAGLQVKFYNRAIQFEEDHALATETLHQEAFTAKQTSLQFIDEG